MQSVCIAADSSGEICDSECYPTSFVCESCDAELIDESTVRGMSPKELSQVQQDTIDCSCGADDYPWPMFACDNDRCGVSMTPSEKREYDELPPKKRAAFLPEGADHWVVQASMFDATLETTITSKTKSINGKNVELKGFNFAVGGWSSAEEDLEAYDLDEETLEKLLTPMDLAERYRPEKSVKRSDFPEEEDGEAMWVAAVLDSQADVLKVDNPFADAKGGASGWKQKGGRRSFKRE